MQPALKERLRWSAHAEDVGDPSASPALMARTFAYFFLMGGSLVLLVLALPHSSDIDEPGMLVVAGAAYAGAALYLLAFDRLPRWSFHVFLVIAVLLVSAASYFAGGTSGTAIASMYFWSALTAFSFFRWPHALLHMLNIGAVYALLITARIEPDSRAVHWVMLMSAMLMAGLMVKLLRTRLEVLVRRLDDAARTDPLTGLLNRRGFDERIAAELARARRAGGETGLVSVDLDHFKRVNDRFGHAVGDQVLERAGTLLRNATRDYDAVARVGGEEFVVLVPDARGAGALALAERIRGGIKASFAGDPFEVTVSCGVATFPHDASTPGELLEASDRALYTAKRLGRDRVVAFTDVLEPVLAV